MIHVSNLTFYYPGKCALSNLNFELPAQSITGLVGPNGAGKTTLLRCLAGLDLPVQGNIVVNGVDVIRCPRQAHQHMGYLPDNYGIYENLTVSQCLRYHAAVYGLPKTDIEHRILEVAEDLQISNQLNHDVGDLSRGQQQRLGIAQIMIHAPKVVFFDEPAANLDPEARQNLSHIFKNLKAKGSTLIVSSHILAELQDYCTHMLILREGQITGFYDIQATHQNMMDVYLENVSV